MLTPADMQALAQQVLWGAFALGIAFGAIAQATHFCTMGAVADLVNFGDWTRMRMWLLAIGVAIVGFNLMAGLGWVRASDSIYAGARLTWLSALVGGAMFGFGMVLASGCGSKSLVRAGAGNLKSLVVVIVLGLSAFATLKGITAVARVATVDAVFVALPSEQDLPSLAAHAFGGERRAWALWAGTLLGGGLIVATLARREARAAQTVLGGLGIGAVIVLTWWLSGRFGHVAEDPSTLEEAFVATNSRRMESLSFVSPIGYTLDWLLFYSDRSKLLTLGIASSVGVVVGAALQSIFARSFRWEAFRGVEDTTNHLVGAVLMGVGGVTALGCTIGQGISGVSTLGLSSFVALAAIVAGAVAALRYQTWRVERLA